MNKYVFISILGCVCASTAFAAKAQHSDDASKLVTSPTLVTGKAHKINLHAEIVTPLVALATCFPECADKHFPDFEDSLKNYMYDHKGCHPKFMAYLKAKGLSLKGWYKKQCVLGCMSVIRSEIKDDEDVKGNVGTGQLGYWASQGVSDSFDVICAKKSKG